MKTKYILGLVLLFAASLYGQYSPANYCADAGASDTYACNLAPSPVAYVTGTTYFFKANTANTGAATINFNSLGAKTIVKVAGGVTTTLADNDIRVGQIVELSYDGTNMQMQSILGNAPGAGSGGTAGSPLAVQTTSVTVTSNTESTLIGSIAGSLTIPANWFTATGTVMEVCSSGILTTAVAAPGTVQFKLKFGSTVVAQTAAFTPVTSLATAPYEVCSRLTARTVGGTGTIMATNTLPVIGTAPGVGAILVGMTNPTPGTAVTVDTTATQVLDLTVTFSANATNSITGTNFYAAGPGSAISSVQGQTGAVTLFNKNAQTGTYQVLAADFTFCKTITVASGTFTITLVASGTQPADGTCVRVLNYGSGVVTVARSGQNINGSTSSQTVAAGSASAPNGLLVTSDGTNYFAQPLPGSAGSTACSGIVSNYGCLLETQTASSSASLNFTACISSTYDVYHIELVNLIPATDAANLLIRVSTDGGATYVNGANTYEWDDLAFRNGAAVTGGGLSTSIDLVDALGQDNGTSYSLVGWFNIYNPGSASLFKRVIGQTVYRFSDNTVNISAIVSGSYLSATAVNAFQLLESSGNIASGLARCYGVSKA